MATARRSTPQQAQSSNEMFLATFASGLCAWGFAKIAGPAAMIRLGDRAYEFLPIKLFGPRLTENAAEIFGGVAVAAPIFVVFAIWLLITASSRADRRDAKALNRAREKAQRVEREAARLRGELSPSREQSTDSEMERLRAERAEAIRRRP